MLTTNKEQKEVNFKYWGNNVLVYYQYLFPSKVEKLTEILRTHKKQTTIHKRRADESVEVLLIEFDRKNPNRDKVIKDRYVIYPNEVIMLGRRT